MDTLSHQSIPPNASLTEAQAPSLPLKALEPNHTDPSITQRWTGKVRQDFDGRCLAQGAGTRDGTLIRNIVSRSEIDLNLTKCHFKKMYGKTLSSMIMVSSHSQC